MVTHIGLYSNTFNKLNLRHLKFTFLVGFSLISVANLATIIIAFCSDAFQFFYQYISMFDAVQGFSQEEKCLDCHNA